MRDSVVTSGSRARYISEWNALVLHDATRETRREEPLDREDDGTPEDRLGALMDRYEPALFRFLCVLLDDPDRATDCAQDTFIRAYDQLRKGRPVNAGWLYKVARNRAMDEYRRQRREAPALERLALGNADELSLEHGAMMREAFAELEPDDRVVLYLLAVEGFSGGEIAGMLGIKPGAVRMRIHRARERFRLAYGGAS